MNPLLEQFLSEAREFLQGIAEKLMQLEDTPDDSHLLVELFRLVHTLKGNSGLFEFPEMTRVLHAGEDLMDAVRDGRVAFSQQLADQLLDAMDFVSALCDQIEDGGKIEAELTVDSYRLSESLRALMASQQKQAEVNDQIEKVTQVSAEAVKLDLSKLPEPVRIEAYKRTMAGESFYWLIYTPIETCFFQGEDPFFTARQTPETLWGQITARESWPKLSDLDAYRCVLDYEILTSASHVELLEQYRYVPDQIQLIPVDPWSFVIPQGDPNGGAVYEDFVVDALQYLDAGDLDSLRPVAESMLQLSNPDLWLSSALRWLLLLIDTVPPNHQAITILIESLRSLNAPDWSLLTANSTEYKQPSTVSSAPVIAEQSIAEPEQINTTFIDSKELSEEDALALETIFAAQLQILQIDDQASWQFGRVKAAASVLLNCCKAIGDETAIASIEVAIEESLSSESSAPLLAWLNARQQKTSPVKPSESNAVSAELPLGLVSLEEQATTPEPEQITPEIISPELVSTEELPKFSRRPDDIASAKSLKVDQSKIDRLMNLIGEIVVSKNALPYLAQRAEEQFGVRELSREIKAQYAVINRIAEEMQDAIMQVRMMPVSFVFQRFPRLVRDISRKLGKEVHLVLEGEETEADKNIIESLADPLIHIVRNSLDHGLELPEVRRAAGKSATGTLTIKANQEGDQVIIEINDDGKGIDPEIIKHKAYEKNIIDEATLERITDREAVNLIFAAGFSTAEVVSDLSGRGVGMDVVRTAVEKVNGTIQLESEVGLGTKIRISLPLSMAVTKVMIIESDNQVFGLPMDHVVEIVRIPVSELISIKQSKTTVFRGKIVALKTLNSLLGLPTEPLVNSDNEVAVLIARIGNEVMGLIVDDFHETIDVIQKPLTGVLAGLGAYSGSALMGDGSVLMILNVRGIL